MSQESPTWQELAEEAYNAFWQRFCPGKNWTPYQDLDEVTKQSWEASVRAVERRVGSIYARIKSGEPLPRPVDVDNPDAPFRQNPRQSP